MAIMANGRVSPGSKYVDWDVKHHHRQTKHFHFFYLTEECVRANMHHLYIDWAVKPELQTNIDTSVNQIYINYICIIAEDQVSDYCGPVGEFKMCIIPIII